MLVPIQLCLDNLCTPIGPVPPTPSPSVLPYRVPDSFPMAGGGGGGGGGGSVWRSPDPEPMPISFLLQEFRTLPALVERSPVQTDDPILSMWQRSLEREAESLETERAALAVRQALASYGHAERAAALAAREEVIAAREAVVAAREAAAPPEPVVYTRTVYVEAPAAAPELFFGDFEEPAPLVEEPRRRPLAAFLPLLATVFVGVVLVTVLAFSGSSKKRRRAKRRRAKRRRASLRRR